MKLHFLGTGAGNYRGSRRHPCGAFVEGLLFDCGAGTTGRLHDLGRFGDVDVILISHLHTDHIAGLFDLLLHTVITQRTRPLTIVSPPGLSDLVRAVVAAGGTVRDPATLYELKFVEGVAPTLTVGRWTVQGVPLDHTLLDLGYRAATDGLSLFYTGDTREPTATHTVSADYLVHESTFAEEDSELARRFGHSTGAQAAAAATAMKARRLFLTHLSDAPDLPERIARESQKKFPDTAVANDGDSFEL